MFYVVKTWIPKNPDANTKDFISKTLYKGDRIGCEEFIKSRLYYPNTSTLIPGAQPLWIDTQK